ncbi:MAG: hypothetical protein M3P10_12135 [Actinomycetota bacterium]|nr:hypothetical protein [Actinomycetota bacterium]
MFSKRLKGGGPGDALVVPGVGDGVSGETVDGASPPVQAAATRTSVQAARRSDRVRAITARDAIRPRRIAGAGRGEGPSSM